MLKLDNQGITVDPPSAGFSEGKLIDNPGNDNGSGAVVATVNDLFYAHEAPIKKYLGGVSDTVESETDSDAIGAIETAAGLKNSLVSEYDTGVTYNEDDKIFYLGVQFVAMQDGILNQDPFTYPRKWRPADDRNFLLARFADGMAVDSGFSDVHNYRHANYRQFFSMGIHNFGGDAGEDKEFTGVHYDGTVITGDATLVALFDVGGANEYPYLDIIAPDVAGTRTLRDYRGVVRSYIDAVAGLRGDIGERQEDAFQGFDRYIFKTGDGGDNFLDTNQNNTPVYSNQNATNNAYIMTGDNQLEASLGKTNGGITTLGSYGTPRIAEESRMKNFSDGIPFCVVMQDA